MNIAYVDTSCLVAIAFGEPASDELARRLGGFDEIFSSNLLEAELRAVLAREGAGGDAEWLSWLTWVLPDRPLSREITRVMTSGYVRGADLWHLACALYLAETPRDLLFLTLDEKQAAISRELGFAG